MLYYIYGNGGLVGFHYDNNTYYYHKNIFNEIIGIFDSNFNEIVTYEYDSWGAIVSVTDNSNINLGTINPFRYRSYYYDEETGLYYLNSRYYNPNWERLINVDSLVLVNGDLISGNILQYVSNNPVSKCDPTGYGLADVLNPPWSGWSEAKEAIEAGLESLGTAGLAISGALGMALPYIALIGGTALLIAASYNYAQSQNKDSSNNNNNTTCNYVYTLKDKSTHEVKYVGRTTNLDLREKQHLASKRSSLYMDRGSSKCLTYEEARGLEHRLILYYGTLNKLNILNNQINGIGANNKNIYNYLIKSQGIFYEEYYVGGPIEWVLEK